MQSNSYKINSPKKYGKYFKRKQSKSCPIFTQIKSSFQIERKNDTSRESPKLRGQYNNQLKEIRSQDPFACHLPSSPSEATQVADGELIASYPSWHEYPTTVPNVRCSACSGSALAIVGRSTGQKPSFAAHEYAAMFTYPCSSVIFRTSEHN